MRGPRVRFGARGPYHSAMLAKRITISGPAA
ncbi:hypothetical protein C8P66_11997 [Humitalea rosea]|uniref:Uncharacterized protein n=1 Tax=Humitalea rosea TaxID=990373 RepID=A0A2W7IAV2_9PROT|nr:hypothetical protein C8P66_11997 [Humitalea rosea]